MLIEPTATGWANDRLLPVFEAPGSLDVYDIRAAPYDTQLAVTTLAGLVNRRQARVYLLSGNDVDELLHRTLAHIPTTSPAFPPEQALDELLARYPDVVQGLIIYDPKLIDSVNVATTLAGLRDAIVVSPALAETLRQPPHTLHVLADLRVYAWKNRLQAYRWAARNLLKQTTPQLVAGINPQIAGGLRSLLVACRAFVYWLDPRFTLPDPSNGWLMERCVMRRILRAFAPGTPHLGWFVDERRGVTLTSKAAMPVLPSDHFSNLEVWIASPADAREGHPYMLAGPPSHPQNNAGNAKVYVSFTMSDGDNLQYCQNRMYRLWQDPARGSIPIGWTISPALQEAAPALAAYYAQTATANDELIAGPSGAGYMLPSKWPAAQLDSYLRLTGRLMQRMRLSAVEVLDELLTRFFPRRAWQDRYARALAPHGVRGMMLGDNYSHTAWFVTSDMPVIQNLGLINSVDMALRLIQDNTPAKLVQPQFLNLYMLAWNVTPSDLNRVAAALDSRYEIVTPGKLLAMIAEMRT